MCIMAAILTMFHQADFLYFRFGGCQEIGLYFRKKISLEYTRSKINPPKWLYTHLLWDIMKLIYISIVYSIVF